MRSVTVLTPTYNRSELLKRCYDSLKEQTIKDFEWLIIDDGSTDNTESIVKEFQQNSAMTIRYIKKQNGGKHTALNIGFEQADSKYLIVLDSDDELIPTAIETIIARWESRKNNHTIGALVFLKADQKNRIVGAPFPKDGEVISKFKQKHIGDKAEVFRTSLLKSYKYPEFIGERFIGESYVWDQVALKYKFAYFNEVIYLCEYLDDGLTKSGWTMRIRNPRGGMAFNNQRMVMPYSANIRMKSILLYDIYSIFLGENLAYSIKQCNRQVWSLLLMPAAWILSKVILLKNGCVK